MTRALGSPTVGQRKSTQRRSVTCPKSHSSEKTELENSGQGGPQTPILSTARPVPQGVRDVGRGAQGSLPSRPWVWFQGLWPLQEFSPAAGSPQTCVDICLCALSSLQRRHQKKERKKKKMNSPAKLKCSPWRGREIKFDEPLHNVQVMNV